MLAPGSYVRADVAKGNPKPAKLSLREDIFELDDDQLEIIEYRVRPMAPTGDVTRDHSAVLIATLIGVGALALLLLVNALTAGGLAAVIH
jgi:hypothetical protein